MNMDMMLSYMYDLTTFVSNELKIQYIRGGRAYFKSGDDYLPEFQGAIAIRAHVFIPKGTVVPFCSGKYRVVDKDIWNVALVSETQDKWRAVRLMVDITNDWYGHGGFGSWVFRAVIPTMNIVDYINDGEGPFLDISEYIE